MRPSVRRGSKHRVPAQTPREVPTGASRLRVVRKDVEKPDAYDLHDAVITVDGNKVGQVALGSEQEFPVHAGSHDVGIRLGMNFNKAEVSIEVPADGTVVVTCEKAHPARNLIFHPSHYWRLSVDS